MKPNNITRAIIDATVDRSLREIEQDPQRSVRKLADMGHRVPARSRFLDDIYDIVQDLLRNDDSPYYTAIGRLLRYTDRKGIKRFFINIGYNSLTFGRKIIRESESSRSFQIPWCLVLHMNPLQRSSINAADLYHFVEQGNALGIYSFIILLDGSVSRSPDLPKIFSENTDSAFVCIMPDEVLDDVQIRQLKSCTNTLIMIESNAASTESNIQKMQSNKLLCGLCNRYSDETADEWIRGDRMKELNQYNSAISFLVPEETCSQETRQRMGQYVRKLRTQPLYPFIPFELTCDVMEINKIICEQPCYFELLENGDILTKDDTVMEYRHTLSLEQMLSFALHEEA